MIKILFEKKVVLTTLFLYYSLLFGAITLVFFSFIFGLIIYVICGGILYSFNSYVLVLRKIDKKVLISNIVSGVTMITTSIILQIYYYLLLGTSLLESTFLSLPLFLGGFLIGLTLKIYKKISRAQNEDTQEYSSKDFSKKYPLQIFITLLMMGVGFLLFLITEDYAILGSIGIIIAIICIIPLNMALKRYLNKFSLHDKKEINKNWILMGQISTLIVIFLSFFFHFGHFNIIPEKPLFVFALIAFESYLILEMIRRSS